MLSNWIEADAYLFDIDGTLLNAYGGGHYNAFPTPLKQSFQLNCKIYGASLHRKTAIWVLRAVLRREGVTDEDFDRHRASVLEHMCEQVEMNRAQIRAEVCPAITELVALLSGHEKVLGVASGNLATIGWLKLEAARLRSY